MDSARGALQGGYERGRAGFVDQYGRAEGALTDEYGRAESAVTGGMDRARSLLNPLLVQGARYDQMYGDALGANGADARSAFYDQNIRANPEFAYADELAAKQMQAKLNASGITGGRAGALQLRQGAQRIEDRTNQYLDRLNAGGARGAQYAGQLAGMEAGAGTQIAGIRTGLGNNLAGVRTGLGDRIGNIEMSHGTAMGNLDMTGASALSGLSARRGESLSGLGMQNAQNIAGIESGYGNNMASNAINYGNAKAGQRGQGLNALLSIGGTALRAATPGLSGVSAFGNIRSGLKSFFN